MKRRLQGDGDDGGKDKDDDDGVAEGLKEEPEEALVLHLWQYVGAIHPPPSHKARVHLVFAQSMLNRRIHTFHNA